MSNPLHDGAKIKAAMRASLMATKVEEELEPLIDSLVERAAAFEALCAEFDGKAKFLYSFKTQVVDTSNNNAWTSSSAIITPRYREVRVFEWKLNAQDCDDFREAALKMGRRKL